MIAARSLGQMLASNVLSDTQEAIVATLTTLLPGITIRKHPGKVDISELVNASVVAAPGVGLGWSQVKYAGMADGSFCMAVGWTAYIVAEAMVNNDRRVEKEQVGLAIGTQLIKILSDDEASFWNRTGTLPIGFNGLPEPELKPFFTIRDAAKGTAYYIVTWTQIIADVGETTFPTATGRVRSPDEPIIDYDSEADLAHVGHWIPARQVPEDEDA
ncbi:MAG: hypothetical protein M9955_15670 [Rhizobiaceae bacterium]|nr:hypothetical protein [Rhizobiaceae bacterium]